MVNRPNVNYPKFKDQFAAMNSEADILPVLSLYPMPEQKALEGWEMKLTDIRGKTVSAGWEDLKKLSKVEEATPLVCQIFNWSETPVVTGVRLPALLEAMGMDLSGSRYLSFYSGDGMYFKSLPLALARDPRVLVVYGIEGERLPHELGGPVRLWVPFLQAYKSVKWLTNIRGFVRDPHGIKRLLGQSKISVLGGPGQEKAHIVVARVGSGVASVEI